MKRSVLVIGECLVDIVNNSDGSVSEHPGGSPANVAVALARLGTPVELATAYADDRLGALLDQHLADSGVALAVDPHVLDHTSSAVATIGPTGSASYVFDIAGALPHPTPAEPPLLVHTGSLGAVMEPGAATVAATLAELAGASTVSYDVNARPAATGVSPELVAQVETLVALSDVVKASDEDLETFFPDASPEASAERLLSLGAGAVVVTWGGRGATCHTRAGSVETPSVKVDVADTIGAGDSFCAAMLDGLRRADLLGAERREALRALPLDAWRDIIARANRAAAITVSRPGANPPTEAELDAVAT